MITMQFIDNEKPYAVSWSGGKDSALALWRSMKTFGQKPSYLLTMMIDDGSRSRSHGLRKDVILKQAEAIGCPVLFVPCSWEDYEEKFISSLILLRQKGIKSMVFGDIKIENDPEWSDHRQWADKACNAARVFPIQPLWDDTHESILNDFFKSKFCASFISVKNTKIHPDMLGKKISLEYLQSLSSLGIDSCGERGEFHTVVTDGPLFQKKLDLVFDPSTISKHGPYWHIDAIANSG